ncbi:hypothetical protein L209DRAFT_764075 [Thermothelomyces heterothallicus CBS 203.75]
MEPLDRVAKTPTRIPRPTSPAASPRTPSIRAVPYSAITRVRTASMMEGSYSPLSWPFPRTADCSSPYERLQSRDHSATAKQPDNGKDTELRTMCPQAAASVSSRATTVETLHTVKYGLSRTNRRTSPSLDSVETQICEPRNGGSIDTGLTSAGAHGLQPMADLPERPMTPTPYSVLRKVSEESPALVTQHCKATHRQSATITTQGPVNAICLKPQGVIGDAACIPVPRDEQGRVISLLHRPPKTGNPRNDPQRARMFTAPTSSTRAERGSSDDGAITNKPGATTVPGLKSLGTAKYAPTARPPSRSGSTYSRRPMTLQSEIPDLESLRLGPRIRHSRLPLSPSMAVNGVRSVPESTKKLWTAVGRSRKIMLASAVLLELSILNLVAGVTAVTTSYIEHGHVATGLAAWAAVSGVFTLTSGAMLGLAFLRYRKMNKELVSGESWIEMHLRSRPLPPRPQSEERRQDNGATEAWNRFVQDHEQLRRYVELLESRIGALEEGQPNMGQGRKEPETDANGGESDAPSGKMERALNAPRNTADSGSRTGDGTPKTSRSKVGDSLSRRQLLQPDDSVAEHESWQGGNSEATISKSDTKASIITELCEAVTEGYSPLSEQMPAGSPQLPQTPDKCTSSARPRGNAFYHLALPGRATTPRRLEHLVDDSGSSKRDI